MKTKQGLNLFYLFFRPTIMVVGLAAALALISGCDKKKDQSYGGGIRPGDSGVTKSELPAQEAPKPVAVALPKADISTPLTSYVKLEDGNQLMFMYYALSGLPVDYEKIAEHYSRDYRNTSDGFKRQDILTAIKPRIDAEIAKAKGSRYFVHTITGPASYVLNRYDFAAKAFPVVDSIWSSDAYSYFNDNSGYEFTYSNGDNFKSLRVEDTEVARKIEGMITAAKDVKLEIFAFAQDASPSNTRIKAQVVKMQLTDGKGKDLLAK